MKKVLCILLVAILTLSLGVTAFAATPVPGDPDGDGYVTSADARRTLRVSAALEVSSGYCDINGDGQVSASDARTLLRMSAKIQDSTFPVREKLDYDRTNSLTKLNLSFSGLCNGQESFYVTVSAENMVGLQNANLFIEYDADVIECVNVQKSDTLDCNLFAGECISEGKIALALGFLEISFVDSDIAVIEFAVKKDGNANFKCNVGTWDGIDAPADVNIQQAVSVDGVHVDTTEHEATLEYFDDSCVMGGYSEGVYCEICNSWISGHKQTIKVVHIDNNSDRVCDYCEAYIGLPDIPETDEESDNDNTDNENSDNENAGMFDSIIAFFKKLFDFLKQLFGV